MLSKVKKIHLIGIGGSGMSGIAEILLSQGFHVSGSDISNSKHIERLESLGAKIAIGHEEKNVQDAQIVIYSSAIQKDNPELKLSQNKAIPILHRSEMLSELIRRKQGIIVAGTHGKTTTTSMLASVLTHAKLDPTIIIGGCLNATQSSAQQGQGKFFLAEADESDGSFLKFNPTVAIVTNIDEDHLDYYKTYDNIKKSFETFMSQVSFDGLVCACLDNAPLRELLPKIKRQKISYGLSKDSDITAKNIQTLGMKSSFIPVVFGKELERVTLNLPGAYNIQNALASFAMGDYLGIDVFDICQALCDYKGVEHRFTLVGEHNNILVVDDYAHNPVKIETVLKAAREHFKDKDIYAVFEPHRYSRVCSQFDDFAKCFSCVDKVIVTPIYGASEAHKDVAISHRDLEKAIMHSSFKGKTGHTLAVDSLKDVTSTLRVVLDTCKNPHGALIITLGAGDVKYLGKQIFDSLKSYSWQGI